MPSRINQMSLAELIAARRNPAAAEGINAAKAGLTEGVGLAESIRSKRVAEAQAQSDQDLKISDFARRIQEFKTEQDFKNKGVVKPGETLDNRDREVTPEVIKALTPETPDAPNYMNVGTGVDEKGARFAKLFNPADQSERRIPLGIDTDKDKDRSKGGSDSQRKALGFYERAKQSHEQLEAVMKKFDPTGAGVFAEGFVPNRFTRPETQQLEQIQRNFVSAVLRPESGAAIPEPELESEKKKYFPQPGDKAPVLEQKRIARETSINALKTQAGLLDNLEAGVNAKTQNGNPPPSGHKSVTQNGVTYQWNAVTGRYE